MSETVPYAPWWKLNINGHAIHVNDDGSYWWWDRTRMFVAGWRPRIKLRHREIMCGVRYGWRGSVSLGWRGRCDDFEHPYVLRAWTSKGLNRKSKRSDVEHWQTCTHPENHRVILPEYRRPGFGA